MRWENIMHYLVKSFSYISLVMFLMGATACSEASNIAEQQAPSKGSVVTLDVYKSPTCGCCTKWVDHLQLDGFSANIHHLTDLNPTKNKYSIAPKYQSCHTAVSSQGYVFEGHVPSRFIKQFLENPPNGALGLTVPAMPVGSPGMEMGDRFMPYQVLLLKENGSADVFAIVDRAEEQYTSGQQP
jgi:hypothetical protein